METSKQAYEVIKRIRNAGGSAYLVGGCVRDRLMGLEVHDEDIATSLMPEEVMDVFKDYKLIPTGLKHGTVTVMVDHIPFEVTTFRIDNDTLDGRHPSSVTFSRSLKDDLARRDLTINAMAYDPFEDKTIDLYHGIDDIKNRLIRCVGDPKERFQEDHLRMLRAIRFAAVLDFNIDEEVKEAIIEYKEDILKVSKERIRDELLKILMCNHSDKGLLLMKETGLLKLILPEVDCLFDVPQNNPNHLYDVGTHTLKVIREVPRDLSLRCAALFHDLGKAICRTQDDKGIDHFYTHPLISYDLSIDIMRRLKFSKIQINKISKLVLYHDVVLKPDRRHIVKFYLKHQELTLDDIEDIYLLKKADLLGQSDYHKDEKERVTEKTLLIFRDIFKGPHTYKDLSLKGDDIQGIQETHSGESINVEGKAVGYILYKLLAYVLMHPENNEKEILKEYMRRHLKGWMNEYYRKEKQS